MAITQKQVLSLQQKLSPQQIQTIKLLELPAMQLEQRIKQEIENNIVLEEDERTPEEEEPQQISVDEYLREDETPSYKSRINNYSKDDKQRPVILSEGRSLQEYLVEQLGYRNLSEREMKLATYLVGSIDEDGYLRRELDAIADDIAFTLGIETTAEELERLLDVIHDLEPAGIGARNLRECLLLQMGQLPMNTPARRLARRILTDYFDEFVKKHYEKLISRLQVSEEEFRDAIAEIRRLTPKPGNLYAEGEPIRPPTSFRTSSSTTTTGASTSRSTRATSPRCASTAAMRRCSATWWPPTARSRPRIARRCSLSRAKSTRPSGSSRPSSSATTRSCGRCRPSSTTRRSTSRTVTSRSCGR